MRGTIEAMSTRNCRLRCRSTSSTRPPASSSSRSATRCGGSPACPPSSPTSPRSSTASCGWSGWSWSASGPRARSTDAENSLTELAALAETAGSQVLEGLIQRRSRPDPATFIGRGKVDELRASWSSTGADTVICDGELSPSPAAQPGAADQGQGRRPDRADPRHLRPARQEQGGQGAGRAGPAASTCCPGCAAGVRRCPGRPAAAAAAAAPAAAWACAVPVRPSWRPTGGGSAPGSPGCSREIKGMRTVRDTKRAAPPPQRGARAWRSPATPTPASPACSTG